MHFIIEFSNGIVPAQFSLNNICAIKSMIVLEMKIPQLMKEMKIPLRLISLSIINFFMCLVFMWWFMLFFLPFIPFRDYNYASGIQI